MRQWLSDLGLTVLSKAGIRIFHDHVDAAVLAGDGLEELLAVERAVRRVEPFASLGQHIHLVAQSSS